MVGEGKFLLEGEGGGGRQVAGDGGNGKKRWGMEGVHEFFLQVLLFRVSLWHHLVTTN